MFRSQRPDEATVKEVMKELEGNKIDISQLVEMKADHCQRQNRHVKEEVPHKDPGVGVGTQPSKF
jgi:hypothetical protein